MEIYQVGGSIRDHYIAKSRGKVISPPKDLDYAVEADSYESMVSYIRDELGCTIFLEKPEFFTVRGTNIEGKACDYTLCRKEGPCSDGRHPDWVRRCSIEEDLSRRDCTMNAIAINCRTGKLLDPTNGIQDINMGLIKAVGNAHDRCFDDGLRILRYMRFSITKDMDMCSDILDCLYNIEDYLESRASNKPPVSTDRIREELLKMFSFNTVATLDMFKGYLPPNAIKYLFETRGIGLIPSTEKRFQGNHHLTPTM